MIRVLLALLLALCAPACEERAAAPPSEPARPALWIVESPSGETAGWLFGTIHALPAGTRWRTPALEQAVGSAGMLVVEVRDLRPDSIGAVFARMARDRPGPPLAERLPPPVRAELAALLEREDAAVGQFDELETWAAALALARLGKGHQAGAGADRALIENFADRPIAELEGAEGQLALFDALPERNQRMLLAAVIAEQGRGEADRVMLADAWLAGDVARLERLTRAGLLADPALYDALLVRRNRAWVARILPLLRQGQRPLVAVGAAHLLGPHGLAAMLADEGFTLRRLQ